MSKRAGRCRNHGGQKIVGQSPAGPALRTERHPAYIETVRRSLLGNPDEKRICTSHIERQNGTMRQWIKRLTRLTYAFSKKWEHLHAALALHFAYYNFCRIHGSLKGITPATAAGVADRRWELAELLAF